MLQIEPKTDRATSRVGLFGLLAIAVVLYVPRLATAPPFLSHDEVVFGVSAHAIATTGRDVDGRFLPLYFRIAERNWFQPTIVYVTAVFLTILPLSEWTVRLPTAMLGLLDIVLMYCIAKRLFRQEWVALAAAGLLMLTPAHYINSRTALDFLYPVPFTLAWLLCLLVFFDRPRPWLAAVATGFLGIGFYSYVASVVMMPLYFGITLFLLVQNGATRTPRYLAAAALGFVLPLTLLFWLVRHPQALAETLVRYHISGAAASFLHLEPMARRVALYWTFFNPGYLFLTGGGNFLCSTGRSGVFPLAAAPLLAVGINHVINSRRTRAEIVCLTGFLIAPVAALIVDDQDAIGREMAVVAFGVLLATFGVERLWTSPNRRSRAIAAGLLVLVPLQFAGFCTDYFTGYRRRAAQWFGNNLPGAMEQLIAMEPPDTGRRVYISDAIPHANWYWAFYLAKHHRTDLLARTEHFDSRNPPHAESMLPGTLLLSTIDDTKEAALTATGQIRRVATSYDPDGTSFFGILERSSTR